VPGVRRVLVITNNLKQASFRVRIDALRPMLRERGFELVVEVRPRGWLARRALLKSAAAHDAVILQRKLLDPSDARLLGRHARKVFYDVDDAVMFHAHAVGRFSQWRTNRRFEATARMVDHVVAGNEYLAAMFRERGGAVTVLPTCLDPSRYVVKEHLEVSPVTLVWIGSSSTLPYLERQVDAIADAARRVALRLLIIADRGFTDSRFAIEHVQWSADTEAASLARGDIGIAPTPSDRWTLGKCGFKIIQYMAAGLSAIASPVGANAEIVVPNETGVLADTPAEWSAAIERLARDVSLRRATGRAARIRAEHHYSLARAADVWAQLLADLTRP
jgi:glycosyltransferase involved in cell wall biosynthesis